jgi:uncharacterized membrane protein YcaP (DUF421 family)
MHTYSQAASNPDQQQHVQCLEEKLHVIGTTAKDACQQMQQRQQQLQQECQEQQQQQWMPIISAHADVEGVCS